MRFLRIFRYAHGETTGVVLDSGDGVTHCVPIFEGFSIQHAATRIDLGGRDITENLALLLRKTGHNFHTSVRNKENESYFNLIFPKG